jgi:hypothetical protein
MPLPARAATGLNSAGAFVAKKPNYDFEKRKKEQDRKKKKDAKREDRLARKRAGTTDDAGGADEGAPGDDPEGTDSADLPATAE